MHDCSIRVTALLKSFEWTHTTGQGEWRQPFYECQAVWGQLLVLFKGRVALALGHQCYQKGVWSLCFHVQD